MKPQSRGLYHCREQSSWKSCSKASEWCSSKRKTEASCENTCGFAVQCGKHLGLKTFKCSNITSENTTFADLSPKASKSLETQKQTIWTKPRFHIKTFTSFKNRLHSNTLQTQPHVCFPENSLPACRDRANPTLLTVLLLPSHLKPHNIIKLFQTYVANAADP